MSENNISNSSELVPSTVVVQLSRLHEKLLKLSEDKRKAADMLDDRDTELAHLQEENEVLKDELANWWNWTSTQKEAFEMELAQAQHLEQEYHQEINRLLFHNAHLREAKSKASVATTAATQHDNEHTHAPSNKPEHQSSGSTSKSPTHKSRTIYLEPIIERESEGASSVSGRPGEAANCFLVLDKGSNDSGRRSEESERRSEGRSRPSEQTSGDHTSGDRTAGDHTHEAPKAFPQLPHE
jgi:hypothetical protein